MQRFLAEIAVTTLFVAPICFSVGGLKPMIGGLLIGWLAIILTSVVARKEKEFNWDWFGTLFGIPVGLLVGITGNATQDSPLTFIVALGLLYFVARFINGYTIQTMFLSNVEEMTDSNDLAEAKRPGLFLAGLSLPIHVIIGFIFGALYMVIWTPLVHLFRLFGSLPWPDPIIQVARVIGGFWESIRIGVFYVPTYSTAEEAALLALSLGLAMSVCGTLGMLVGYRSALVASRGFFDFSGTFEYVKAMVWPVIGFAVGYALILLAFAGLYSALFRLDPNAFTGFTEGNFSDFLFFSLMTLTTLGYSPLIPVSGMAKFLTSIQALINLAWIVVIFAAVIAYVEPRFRVLHERPTKFISSSASEDDEEVGSFMDGVRQGFSFMAETLTGFFPSLRKAITQRRHASRRRKGPSHNTPLRAEHVDIHKSQEDDDQAEKIPTRAEQSIVLSVPNIGVGKISYELETDKLLVFIRSLEGSSLRIRASDICVSCELPQLSPESALDIDSRTGGNVTKIILGFPITSSFRGAETEVNSGYIHVRLLGIVDVPNGGSVEVSSWEIGLRTGDNTYMSYEAVHGALSRLPDDGAPAGTITPRDLLAFLALFEKAPIPLQLTATVEGVRVGADTFSMSNEDPAAFALRDAGLLRYFDAIDDDGATTRCVDLSPGVHDYCTVLLKAAVDRATAHREIGKQLRLTIREAGDDPGVSTAFLDVLIPHLSLLIKSGNPPGAEVRELVDDLISLSQVAIARRMYDSALRILEICCGVEERAFGPLAPEVAATYSRIGSVEMKANRPGRASYFFRKSLVVRELILGPEDLLTIGSRENVGLAMADFGATEEATFLLEATLAEQEALFGSDHPDTLRVLRNLAIACEGLGADEKAQDFYSQLLSRLEVLLGVDHPETVSARESMNEVIARRQSPAR